MEIKRLFALSGFTFASVLAVMPGTARAAGMTAVAEAVEAQAAGNYPHEKLSTRLERIMRNYRVEITFDYNAASRVTVPAQKKSDVMKDIAGSLAATGFACRQNGAGLFSVYVRNARHGGGTSSSRTVPASYNRAPQQSRQGGTLTGTVLDKDGAPIVGATIRITGTGLGAVSDQKGEFRLKGVPAYKFTVEVSCISYATIRVSDITVGKGQTRPLDVILQDATKALEGVTVTATYNNANANALYARQKNMVAMSDGISADLMRKTSDNNVAQVLKRVSGVTVNDGKYVTVRGMGERYNNVELNGASMPSTEPNRRNFSFDVIPSSLIDNVTITKTFTPDEQGEFTGGLVEVNTLSIPHTPFVNLSLGTGMNTQSTGKDFYSNKRYKGDWFFGNTNDRKWYTGPDKVASGQNITNAGQKNTYPWSKYTAMPLQNYNIVAGKPFEFGVHRIGVVAALTYRNEQVKEKILEQRTEQFDTLITPGARYKMMTSTGAVLNVGWEMPGQQITFRNLYNSRFTHTNTERVMFDAYSGDRDWYERYSVPLVAHLFQTQLEGEHHLFKDNLIFTWNTSYNKVTRTNPDDRYSTAEYKGELADGTPILDWHNSTRFSSPTAISDAHAMYSGLKETKKNIALNLEHPFVVAGNRQSVKAGYMGTFRRADYEQEYLKPIDDGSGKGFGSELPNPEEFFAPSRFNGNGLKYEIGGLSGNVGDTYHGRQDLHAAYLMGEFSFFKKLHLTTGVRMESNNMSVNTKDLYALNNDTTTSIKKTNWLPAANIVYNILDNLNARFAYSKTLARPDFRELTRTTYYDVEGRLQVYNRGELKQTTTDNYDIRIEWYPENGEVISLSAFYKRFRLPIEMITVDETGTGTNFTQYSVNLDNATVKGLELNFRKGLAFIAPGSFLKDIYVNGNFSLIGGNVDYTLFRTDNKKRERTLQGLAPYTVNAGLNYQGNVFGAAVNYGRSGRVLVMSANESYLDQYQNPRNVLDVQLSARFLKNRQLEVKFNASDLLNEDYIVYRNGTYEAGKGYVDLTGKGMDYNNGDWVMSRVKRGINLSISVNYRL